MSSQPESSAQSGKGSVWEGAMGHGPGAVESATSPLNKTTADDPGTGPTGDSWRRATEHERGGGGEEEVAFPRVKPKMTRGRVKIDIDFIQDRFRRRTTFSKRKKYIIKKAKELATLTGSQVLVLACSETGLVHKWSTPMFQPVINSEDGKALIKTCLGSGRPGDPSESSAPAGSKEPEVAFQLPETEGLQGHSEGGASPVGTATTSTPAPMRYYHHMQMPLNVMPPGKPPTVSLSKVHMAMQTQRAGQHAFYIHDILFPVQTAPAFPGSSPMVTGQQQQQ